MSNYVKATNFFAKDALLTGNPDKIIKGAEIDDEFNAISVAITTKANIDSPVLTGTPTAPTAAAGTNSTQIATTAYVITNGFPQGGIMLWSGSIATIPSGFAICDGTSGTPDLRNRFLVGAGNTYPVGAAGGSANAIVPSHTHSATVTDPGHSHVISRIFIESGGNAFDAGGGLVGTSVNTLSSTTGITVANSTTGVSGTNANLPPYYALAYIMKL